VTNATIRAAWDRSTAEVDVAFVLAGECGCEDCIRSMRSKWSEEIEEALDAGLRGREAADFARALRS
jgi:alkylhydroperoxidase family enzyme